MSMIVGSNMNIVRSDNLIWSDRKQYLSERKGFMILRAEMQLLPPMLSFIAWIATQ